ncbi:MAG: serralysin [Paracoccaceae bacterium]
MINFIYRQTIISDPGNPSVEPRYMDAISDLEIRMTANGAVLYAASGAESGLTAFTIFENQMATYLDELGPSGSRGTEAVDQLDFVQIAGDDYLLPSGRNDDRLALHALSGTTGAFDGVEIYGSATELPGRVSASTSVILNGMTYSYMAQANQSGIIPVAFDSLTSARVLGREEDSVDTHFKDITALANATIGARTFIFSASGTEHAITSVRAYDTGALNPVDSLGPSEGLWIAAPTAIEVVVAGGNTYLIVGAAGSDSLSVVKVNAWGGLSVTDHILDDLDSRFQNATDIESVKYKHRVLVLVGGSDDGITLFELTPSGLLFELATITDTFDTTLGDVSAIAAAIIGDEMQVYVGSSTETGITQFTVDLGAFGVLRRGSLEAEWLNGIWADDLLDGFEGDDVLKGNNGDDRLIDGDGQDKLYGGRGEDTFIFVEDGDLDSIKDFEPGRDLIDLSQFEMLYSFEQLTLEQRSYGVVVRANGEALRVESEISTLQVADLGADDFLF